MNIVKLTRNALMSKDQCLDWCQTMNLIPREKLCPICQESMTLDINRGDIGRWRCKEYSLHRQINRRINNTEVEVALADGTWFANSKLSIKRSILLTYCWSQRFSYKTTRHECRFDNEQISDEIITDWFNHCREVCMISLDTLYERQGLIGGPGCVVEINESKIGKRKYNVGRMVEGHWILGMVEIGTDKTPFRLEIYPENKRDAETLLSLIQRHVAPETTIITNCDLEYNHLTVNHSYNFIDPATYSHIQHVETNWRPQKKKFFTAGLPDENLAGHFCEYLWRREVERNNSFFFESLIRDIGQINNW